MAEFACTYRFKLISGEEIRKSALKGIPILCKNVNCTCNINIISKWYSLKDEYTIDVFGKVSDVNKIGEDLEKIAKVFYNDKRRKFIIGIRN